MKRTFISVIVLFIAIFSLAFFIYNTQGTREHFFQNDKTINNLLMLNKDINAYLSDNLKYDNFNSINQITNDFKEEVDIFQQNTKKLDIDEPLMEDKLKKLSSDIEYEISAIDKIKSYRAILNNSYRLVQRIYEDGVTKNLNHVYTFIMTLDKNSEINKKNKIESLKTIIPLYRKNAEVSFLKHSKIILDYNLKLDRLKKNIDNLNLEARLRDFREIYEKYLNKSMEKSIWATILLFILLILLTIAYIIYERKLIISNEELSKFKQTVENSDNIVVITDTQERIKFVNQAFTKTTGYSFEEAIGQKPNILKSGVHSPKFYQDLHKTIFSGKSWSNEFVNIDKFGELSYEKATITPVLDNEGNIKEFIAIKLDITSERVTENKLKESEKLLVQQSKMAAMGEMIENIAHQWRQPLSTISTSASGLVMKKEVGMEVEEKEIITTLKTINDTSQYLSETIDNFRDFFKPNKQKVECNLNNLFNKTLKMVKAKYDNIGIEFIKDIDNSISANILDSELVQVIMNILSNAKDAFETSDNIDRKLIFVTIKDDDKNIIMSIKDNAGGIPEDVISRIFEPYFSTKHKSTGTGIGLYMSLEIIEKHMQGKLTAKNVSYEYENLICNGAKFTIILPKEIEESTLADIIIPEISVPKQEEPTTPDELTIAT